MTYQRTNSIFQGPQDGDFFGGEGGATNEMFPISHQLAPIAQATCDALGDLALEMKRKSERLFNKLDMLDDNINKTQATVNHLFLKDRIVDELKARRDIKIFARV